MSTNPTAMRLLWPTVAAVMALMVLISLGTWQWQRRAWKEDLLRRITQRAAAEPLSPDRALAVECSAEPSSCEYIRVRLNGRFDHSGERHIFIAVPPQASGPSGTGYWVFTPFRIDGLARPVYVNRGFVPEASKQPDRRASGQIADTVEIVAQIRFAEPRGRFSNQNDPAANVYYVRDPRELSGGGRAAAVNLGAPAASSIRLGDPLLYLDMTGPAPPGGLPAPLAGRIQIPNRHLEYALTWWALAATLAGVYAAFAWQRLRPRPAP